MEHEHQPAYYSFYSTFKHYGQKGGYIKYQILLLLLFSPQADGFSKVAPLVVLYAGRPQLLQVVEEAVRVTQDDDRPVSAAITGN